MISISQITHGDIKFDIMGSPDVIKMNIIFEENYRNAQTQFSENGKKEINFYTLNQKIERSVKHIMKTFPANHSTEDITTFFCNPKNPDYPYVAVAIHQIRKKSDTCFFKQQKTNPELLTAVQFVDHIHVYVEPHKSKNFKLCYRC